MLIRPFLTLSLVTAVAFLTTTSEAAKPTIPTAAAAKPAPTKKGFTKGHSHVHHGVVEKVALKEKEGSVEHGGSITIKEHHHKKKSKSTTSTAAKPEGKTEGKEETFKIEKHTKIEREGKPAKLDELKKGEHVIIHAKDKVAEKIDIVHHKHKKSKKKKKPAA